MFSLRSLINTPKFQRSLTGRTTREPKTGTLKRVARLSLLLGTLAATLVATLVYVVLGLEVSSVPAMTSDVRAELELYATSVEEVTELSNGTRKWTEELCVNGSRTPVLTVSYKISEMEARSHLRKVRDYWAAKTDEWANGKQWMLIDQGMSLPQQPNVNLSIGTKHVSVWWDSENRFVVRADNGC